MPFAAPICMGSKIYERTSLKVESGIGEEPVCQWIQSKALQQLEQDIGMPDLMKRDTQTRLSELYETSNRAGIPMNSTVHKFTGQKEGTTNGYLGGSRNLLQAINFTTTKPLNARNRFLSLLDLHLIVIK
jgi:hypothetical protein